MARKRQQFSNARYSSSVSSLTISSAAVPPWFLINVSRFSEPPRAGPHTTCRSGLDNIGRLVARMLVVRDLHKLTKPSFVEIRLNVGLRLNGLDGVAQDSGSKKLAFEAPGRQHDLEASLANMVYGCELRGAAIKALWQPYKQGQTRKPRIVQTWNGCERPSAIMLRWECAAELVIRQRLLARRRERRGEWTKRRERGRVASRQKSAARVVPHPSCVLLCNAKHGQSVWHRRWMTLQHNLNEHIHTKAFSPTFCCTCQRRTGPTLHAHNTTCSFPKIPANQMPSCETEGAAATAMRR